MVLYNALTAQLIISYGFIQCTHSTVNPSYGFIVCSQHRSYNIVTPSNDFIQCSHSTVNLSYNFIQCTQNTDLKTKVVLFLYPTV